MKIMEKDQKKKEYEKPKVTRITLDAKCAVLGFCKQVSTGSGPVRPDVGRLSSPCLLAGVLKRLSGPGRAIPIRMPTTLSFTIADLSVTLRWHSPFSRVNFRRLTSHSVRRAEATSVSTFRWGNRSARRRARYLRQRTYLVACIGCESGSSFHLFDSYPELKRTLFIPDEGGSARLSFHAADRDPFVGPSLELLMITHLARRDGVILHGCGISSDGRGVVFAGESGAGKSTLSRLWAQKEGIEILSDDRVIVRRQNGSFRLYGTPWHGDEAFAAPGGVELSRIFFIRHGQGNDIRKLSAAGAVREMLKCSFPPLWDAGGMAAALELFHTVAVSVPCAELAFVPDHTAMDFVLDRAGGTRSIP